MEKIVSNQIKHVSFLLLTEMYSIDKKTCFLSYSKLMRAPYLSKFKPEVAPWFSEQELVFMTSSVDSSIRTLSTFFSAIQGFSAGISEKHNTV